MNLRISPAALLIVTAFITIVTVELRTLLDMLGVAVSVETTALVGLVAILVVWIWTFLPTVTGADPGNGSGNPKQNRAD